MNHGTLCVIIRTMSYFAIIGKCSRQTMELQIGPLLIVLFTTHSSPSEHPSMFQTNFGTLIEAPLRAKCTHTEIEGQQPEEICRTKREFHATNFLMNILKSF